MQGVFAAETAVLVHFQPVGIVLFVLCGVVIALFALCASQRYFNSCAFCCHNAPSEHEKIKDAEADNDRQKKYSYIRLRREIQRGIDQLKYGQRFAIDRAPMKL